MQRQVTALLYLLATAGSEVKEKIRQREELNQDQPVPTRTGAAVFIWQLECGRQYRRRVRTGHIRELWDRTARAQRTYNPLRNEYDVDDTARDTILPDPSTPYELNNTENPAAGAQRSRSASPVPRSAPAQRPRSPIRRNHELTKSVIDDRSTTRLADITGDDTGNNADFASEELFTNMANVLLSDSDKSVHVREPSVDVLSESIHIVLTKRYGYIAPQKTWVMAEKEAKEWESNGWKKLYRTLGQRDIKEPAPSTPTANDSERLIPNAASSPSPPFTPLELPAISDFVAALRRNVTIPALCDLDPSLAIACADTSYASLTTLNFEEEIELHAGETVTRAWYMLHSIEGRPLVTSTGCRVSTQLATNVQHAKRAGFGRTADEILTSMVARGMKMRVSKPVSSPIVTLKRKETPALIGKRPVGVGIKPHGVKLTALDYKAYMEMRDELLSGPAGEMALLEGGIIWRLAVNVCSIDDAVRGPERDSSSSDIQIRETRIAGQSYAENVLSQHDKYVIVGVYRILLDGKCTKPSVTLHATENIY